MTEFADTRGPWLISRRSLLSALVLGIGQVPPAFAGAAQSRPAGELPFRHIHLDFHTSPAVPDVGADFSAQEFARTLKDASVNSITIFGKCHHGMSYYPTKVGVRHPGVKTDLVGEMIEACHRAGILVPVYLSTMYDHDAWRRRADWRALDEEGRSQGHRGAAGPLATNLGRVCVNTPYLDYLAAQAEEVVQTYAVDGIFYDNYGYGPDGCLCASCMLEREKLGLDSGHREDRLRHGYMVLTRAMERLAAIVRAHKPKGRLFFNGAIRLRQRPDYLRRALACHTHIEIESLPGGSWGYRHFQSASRYLRNLGLDTMGMTGSFHRSWGDFGSVRNQAALDYECFAMLAQAAKCSIGDHLHPRGKLNPAVYERIGTTFRSVAEKEPWCSGARAVTEIASLVTYRGAGANDSDVGVTAILSQLHHQFDLIDADSDWQGYRVLVLPDSHRLDDRLREKLAAYLAGGGKLLLSHESGLDAAGEKFGIPDIGLEYEGPWKREVQYIEVLGEAGEGIPKMVHVAYEAGSAVKALPETTVLARVWAPYFDRNFRHFHVEQTPDSAPTDYVAAAARGNVIYIATPIFRSYSRFGYAVYRQLVANCLRRFLPDPLVRVDAPSTAQVTMTEQPGRRIVHVLSYTPERRTPELDIVEDVIPLAQVKLAARLDRRPRQVYLAPQRQTLQFEYRDGYAHAVVPGVRGHQMIVLEL